MGREIRKKVIDNEIKSSTEDLDDKMLEQIEKEFDQITSTGGTLKSTDDTASFDFFANEAAKTSFSLDDFETSIDKGDDLLAQTEEPKPPGAKAAEGSKEAEKDKAPAKYRATIARKKLIAIGIAALLALLASGSVLYWFLRELPSPKPQVVKMIRRPIGNKVYKEKFDFLIPANAQRERDLVALKIEFDFRAQNAFEDFEKENIVFRDVIYQFLRGERPVRNTDKYWQKIVESNLLNYLKAIFPKSGMDSIHMVDLNRL